MRTIANAAGGMSVRVPPINAYQMTRKSCCLRYFPADHVVEPPVIVSQPTAERTIERQTRLSFSLSGPPPGWKNASQTSLSKHFLFAEFKMGRRINYANLWNR
jgi:hypothetical protein